MDLIKGLAEYAENNRDDLSDNEAATKQSLVRPIIRELGYNIDHVTEVYPEFTADIDSKKGKPEKVDFAIMSDGEPIILIECKALNKTLDGDDVRQLFRYFASTKTNFSALSFGVLTNGVVYRFFSDLKSNNVMDQTPFWEMDIRSADEDDLAHLSQFAKVKFDAVKIKDAAVEANVIRCVKANLGRMYDAPTVEFSRTLFHNVVAGDRTIRFAARNHRELVKRAFHDFVREHSSAMSGGEFPQETISGASQSTRGQASATVIPPNPSPDTPTDGWQPLSDFQPRKGVVNPTQMMFPDNSEVAITTWNQVAIQAVRWLTDNGRLDVSHCPIQRTSARYLVATQPIHPSGKEFTHTREVNSLHVELSYPLLDTIKNVKFIIERAGMDASQFKLRW